MGIKDIIEKWKENKSIDKQKLKEAETEMKIQKILTERSKSANQRELEKYYKEQEEKNIKTELDKIRKIKTKESWSGSYKILKNGTPITKDVRPILKEKNIFLDNKNNIPFNKGGNQFFKW